MSDPFVRSITFSIAATATSPAIQITAVETSAGTLQFSIDVISTSRLTGDLRGLFFDFTDDSLLSSLKVAGSNITAFDTVDVTNLGNGVTMQSAGAPYDVGVAFGTANLGKDDIKHQTFTLSSTSGSLTLDDIAGVDFGVRLTSVGSPTGSRTASSKLVTTATAAPDAIDDTFNVYEDGRADLNHPASASSPLVFQVLVNDTDADHNVLIITATDTPGHGTLSVIDGDDADLVAGDALQYTPAADYAGTDQFRYAVSDGHGGTDFAWVHVNIAAVADTPTVSYTIEAGPGVDQVIVHVTASVHDTDGSEYIDRFQFSGLPPGVQVSAPDYGAVDLNPATQPQQLTRDFLLMLPGAQDANFDFTVTAIAKEKSNGDEESASVSAPVIYDQGETHASLSFIADDRSIWGEHAPTSINASDVQESTFSFSKSLDDVIGYAVSGYATPGIRYQLALQNGEVDANLDYDLTVVTRYNKTTDQMVISSGAALTGGDFKTAAMSGALAIDAFLDLGLSASLTYDFSQWIDTPDAQGVLATLPLGGTIGLPILNVASTQLTTPVDITDIFGNHIALDWPASGSDAGAMAADGSLSSIVDGSGFASLGLDLDLMMTLFGNFPNMIIPIDLRPMFFATLELMDLDMSANLDFNQDFALKPMGLAATITFEDSNSYAFLFGQDFTVTDPTAIDAAGNHDGKVDFSIAIDPVASFSNKTTMDMDLSFLFQALKFSGSYNVLDLFSGSFSLGPAYSATLTPDIPQGSLFNDSFALDFVGQSVPLSTG